MHRSRIFSELTYFLFVALSLIFVNCSESSNTEPIDNSDHKVTLKIFYTNDEHGWLESTETSGGATGMMSKWKSVNGFNNAENNFLVLSGGDMWTGPAISTWFSGEPMTEIMNAMDYNVAAIGNHEFDFSQDGLRTRLTESNFPFLAANLKSTVTGTYPDFVQPYKIIQKAGIKIGIIGLTSSSTVDINFPENVKNLTLMSYTDALNEIVPIVKAQGAEILILIAHAAYSQMTAIKSVIQNHGISVVGCGHDHSYYLEETENFALFEARCNMQNYAYVEINYDTLSNTLINLDAEIYGNPNDNTADPDIQNIVSNWQSAMNSELSEVIGYTATGLDKNSHQIRNLITDSWLYTFSDAQIALSNYGGVRQGIPAGNITMADIVGVLPFDNDVVKLELTGSQIKTAISTTIFFVGGLNVLNGYKLNDGSTLRDESTYKVLFTDYIYLTNEYLQQYDSTPEYTYINWRDPVINRIKSLNTSATDPLENHIDNAIRQNSYMNYFY